MLIAVIKIAMGNFGDFLLFFSGNRGVRRLTEKIKNSLSFPMDKEKRQKEKKRIITAKIEDFERK